MVQCVYVEIQGRAMGQQGIRSGEPERGNVVVENPREECKNKPRRMAIQRRRKAGRAIISVGAHRKRNVIANHRKQRTSHRGREVKGRIVFYGDPQGKQWDSKTTGVASQGFREAKGGQSYSYGTLGVRNAQTDRNGGAGTQRKPKGGIGVLGIKQMTKPQRSQKGAML